MVKLETQPAISLLIAHLVRHPQRGQLSARSVCASIIASRRSVFTRSPTPAFARAGSCAGSAPVHTVPSRSFC